MELRVNLSNADLRLKNVQVRFRALKRREMTCTMCGRKRLICSTRLKVCQVCFHAAILYAKGST